MNLLSGALNHWVTKVDNLVCPESTVAVLLRLFVRLGDRS